jgi:serine/threonine protein kinase
MTPSLPTDAEATLLHFTGPSSGQLERSPPSAPNPRLFPDAVIGGKYRLEYLLGEGGMGSVWRAFNLQLEIPVAIKFLRTGLGEDASLGERLRCEARAAAKLVHPNIVRVFDIGESDWGEPFIVMELLSGERMGALLARRRLSAEEAVRLLLPIAEALALAHSRCLVHRDLKPDNVLLGRDKEVIQPKLVDFGIATLSDPAARSGPKAQAGTLTGSPEYMSPEQARGSADIDHRSDIWSFCVVLYEAIAGHLPFDRPTCRELLGAIIQDEPPSLEAIGAAPAQLSELVQRGLSKDRGDRPATILELGGLLAEWLLSQGVREDISGASLEVRWLGRASTDSGTTSTPSGARAPVGVRRTWRFALPLAALSCGAAAWLFFSPPGRLAAPLPAPEEALSAAATATEPNQVFVAREPAEAATVHVTLLPSDLPLEPPAAPASRQKAATASTRTELPPPSHPTPQHDPSPDLLNPY